MATPRTPEDLAIHLQEMSLNKGYMKSTQPHSVPSVIDATPLPSGNIQNLVQNFGDGSTIIIKNYEQGAIQSRHRRHHRNKSYHKRHRDRGEYTYTSTIVDEKGNTRIEEKRLIVPRNPGSSTSDRDSKQYTDRDSLLQKSSNRSREGSLSLLLHPMQLVKEVRKGRDEILQERELRRRASRRHGQSNSRLNVDRDEASHLAPSLSDIRNGRAELPHSPFPTSTSSTRGSKGSSRRDGPRSHASTPNSAFESLLMPSASHQPSTAEARPPRTSPHVLAQFYPSSMYSSERAPSPPSVNLANDQRFRNFTSPTPSESASRLWSPVEHKESKRRVRPTAENSSFIRGPHPGRSHFPDIDDLFIHTDRVQDNERTSTLPSYLAQPTPSQNSFQAYVEDGTETDSQLDFYTPQAGSPNPSTRSLSTTQSFFSARNGDAYESESRTIHAPQSVAPRRPRVHFAPIPNQPLNGPGVTSVPPQSPFQGPLQTVVEEDSEPESSESSWSD